MRTPRRPFSPAFDLLTTVFIFAPVLLIAATTQGVVLEDVVAGVTQAPPESGFVASLWQAVAPQLVPLLAAVILGGVSWLTKLLYGLAKRLVETRVHNEYARGVFDRLADAVYTAVKSTEGRVAAAVRKAAADGQITPEERADIQRAALADVQALLGPKGIGDLAYVLGLPGASAPGASGTPPDVDKAALEAALAPRLEAALVDLKNAGVVARPAAPSAPPSP